MFQIKLFGMIFMYFLFLLFSAHTAEEYIIGKKWDSENLDGVLACLDSDIDLTRDPMIEYKQQLVRSIFSMFLESTCSTDGIDPFPDFYRDRPATIGSQEYTLPMSILISSSKVKAVFSKQYS